MVSPPPRQRGVTYLALLLAIALVSGTLAATAHVWSQAQRREREKQLLWVGEQFRRAIAAYARAGNGAYPRNLEDLLEDARSPAKRRYLRRIYEDPMTDTADWALIRNPQGGIIGLHSRHEGVPIKTGRFPPQYLRFERARTYADWQFAAATLPADAQAATPAAAPEGVGRPAGAAPAPADAPGDSASPRAPRVPRRAEAPGSAPFAPGTFTPSPLTPLQDLRSPYAPRALPGPTPPEPVKKPPQVQPKPEPPPAPRSESPPESGPGSAPEPEPEAGAPDPQQPAQSPAEADEETPR